MRHRATRFLLFVFWLPAIAAADVVRLQPVVNSKLAGGGCYISFVQPKSAADTAGLMVGDVVLEAGGKTIGTITDLHDAVSQADGEFPLKIQRGDKTSNLTTYVHASKSGPKLGVRCNPMPSAPFTFTLSSFTVMAQASMVQDLTLVRVRILNHSTHTLSVSPHLFSIADGDRVMLKLLEPSEVTTILQADLQSSQMPPETASGEYRNSMTPVVQTLGSYLFGTLGMKGDTARLATIVATGISESMATPPTPVYAAPRVTPALVAKEALETSELEPGYAAEGIVFFNGATHLPVTLMTKIDGEKSMIGFNAASPADAQAPTSEAEPANTVLQTSASRPASTVPPLNCPIPFPDHARVKLTLSNGKTVEGKLISCEPQKVAIRSGLLYRTFTADRVAKIELSQ